MIVKNVNTVKMKASHPARDPPIVAAPQVITPIDRNAANRPQENRRLLFSQRVRMRPMRWI